MSFSISKIGLEPLPVDYFDKGFDKVVLGPDLLRRSNQGGVLIYEGDLVQSDFDSWGFFPVPPLVPHVLTPHVDLMGGIMGATVLARFGPPLVGRTTVVATFEDVQGHFQREFFEIFSSTSNFQSISGCCSKVCTVRDDEPMARALSDLRHHLDAPGLQFLNQVSVFFDDLKGVEVDFGRVSFAVISDRVAHFRGRGMRSDDLFAADIP